MDEVKLLPCPLWRNDCEFLLSVIDSCDEAEAPSCEMEPEDVARIDLIRKLLATRPPIVTDEVVERLRDALEPFAKIADAYEYWSAEAMPAFSYPEQSCDLKFALEDCPNAVGELTESDFIRARAAMPTIDQDGGEG